MKIRDIKWRLLSKHWFQKEQEHGSCTKPLNNDKFMKELYLPVVTWNEKLVSFLVQTFLQQLFLKVFEMFVFRQSERFVVYFGLYESSLHF